MARRISRRLVPRSSRRSSSVRGAAAIARESPPGLCCCTTFCFPRSALSLSVHTIVIDGRVLSRGRRRLCVQLSAIPSIYSRWLHFRDIEEFRKQMNVKSSFLFPFLCHDGQSGWRVIKPLRYTDNRYDWQLVPGTVKLCKDDEKVWNCFFVSHRRRWSDRAADVSSELSVVELYRTIAIISWIKVLQIIHES